MWLGKGRSYETTMVGSRPFLSEHGEFGCLAGKKIRLLASRNCTRVGAEAYP